MQVALGRALDGVATPGVPRGALERLDRRVANAHERIATGRRRGEYGYASLSLPDRVDAGRIRETVAPFRDAAAVLTVGIGGSALGAATVAQALQLDDAYVLDNADPLRTARLLESLPLDQTLVHLVSRSGRTAETLANFRAVRGAMADAGVDWTERTVVTTGADGPLRELAERRDLRLLAAPRGVPGRFSVLSAVGLVPAAARGVPIERLLEGGRAASETLEPSLFETPAYAYGATAYALSQRGVDATVMMPYDERLGRFVEWFRQLWAESLGKAGLGQTPVGAMGATDQHSQLQLYRAGPRDKLVTLVRPRERSDPGVPSADPLPGEPDFLRGRSLRELLDAEYEATAASLTAARRPVVEVEVRDLGPRSLGELLYGMEAACVLAGELFGVDPFDQPAVEGGKERARRRLRADGEREPTSREPPEQPLLVG